MVAEAEAEFALRRAKREFSGQLGLTRFNTWVKSEVFRSFRQEELDVLNGS